MEKVSAKDRPYWKEQARSFGYDYYSTGPSDEDVGWLDNSAYVFSMNEIDRIEQATFELNMLCLMAVEQVTKSPELMDCFGIEGAAQELVQESWRNRDKNPELLGRFDFAYNPETGAIKLIEFNADTPTSTIETAVIQWHWLQENRPEKDQFSSLHESILARLNYFKSSGRVASEKIFFAPYPESLEDWRHSEYYADLAGQAGFKTEILDIKDIGWRKSSKKFVSKSGETIDTLLKIYPWELMVKDRYAQHILESGIQIIEPAWKMILSNKALLPMLWEMCPACPWLLKAQWSPSNMMDYVVKPIFSRGGQNVTIVRNGETVSKTEGTYGNYPMVYQEFVNLPSFDGRKVVIGSWVVGQKPSGMIVREGGPDGIIVDRDYCVPHFIA